MDDLQKVLIAMEKIWEPLEEEWAFTQILHKLEETCPEHRVGEKSLALMRYKCPVCKKVLRRVKYANTGTN